MKNTRNEEQQKESKKYYEVWGDSLNLLYYFKSLSLVLIGVIVILVIMLKYASEKTPIVVKVDQLGNTMAITNWESDVKITIPEIKNFTNTFLEQYLGYDYYAYDSNFRKAFTMMTPTYSAKADRYIETNKVLDSIKQGQLKTVVNISKIDIMKDTKEVIILKIKGYKTYSSYISKDFNKEQIYEDDLVLQKVKRSEKTPWGLLVDDFNETIIKE